MLRSTLRNVVKSSGISNAARRRTRPQVEALEERVVLSFAPAAPVPVGDGPESVVAADFNGDGRPDLAVANASDGSVSVRLGNPDGSFSTAPNVPVGGNPVAIAVGDFNGDGRPDLAVANLNNSVSIRLGQGGGTFGGTGEVSLGFWSAPRSVAVGDFNGDRIPDLATANVGTDSVSILQGNGDGTFSPRTPIVVVGGPWSVAVGEFTGDGRRDLAVTKIDGGAVSILRGNGDGTFSPAPADVPVGEEPRAVAVSDLNGDGRDDLVVANRHGDTLSIRLGNGDSAGPFRPAATAEVPAGDGPVAVVTEDFNGDGKRDLAFANSGNNTVGICLGEGTGLFGDAVFFAVGARPVSLAVGDFNGDGKLDLAVANTSSDNASILLNQFPGPAPTPRDVTELVGVRIRFRRRGLRRQARVTLTNHGARPLTDLKAVVLPSGRKARLLRAAGLSEALAPGRPFVGVVPSTLQPGQSTTLTLRFSGPIRPRFRLLLAEAPGIP